MKELKSILKEFSEYQLFIQRIMMILMSILFFLSLMTKKNLMFGIIIILLISVFYGIFSFCLINDDKAKKQFNSMVITIALGISGILNGILFDSFNKIAKGIPLILDILILVVAYVFAHPNKEKDPQRFETINSIIKTDMYTKNGLGNGDTYLGYDPETGKPNVIPYKDRFLHFLVLGVTGCGKTSQSLIPMVANDMDSKDLGVVCLDPKGDFAETVCALAVAKGREDEVTYFNPILEDCPYFNPMVGDLNSVTECLVTTFKKLENEQQTFFANMDEMIMRRCIKISKWLYEDDANLNDINILMNNVDNKGKGMLKEMKNKIDSGEINDKMIESEFEEIESWFMNDYYTGLSGARGATKTYEQCSGVRNQVSKLLANSLVKRLLCPTKSDGSRLYKSEMKQGEYIDFDGVLEKGGILAMSSAQGELRELGTFIGYFLILTFESAVFRRPGDENTRKGVIFYVDEFQKYANDGYNDLLTQGRSYRVSSVLATQTRAGIAANSSGQEGKNLIETVSSNCRNKIIYPGGSYEDANYYSKEFGDHLVTKERHGKSHAGGLMGGWNPSSTNVSTNIEETYEPYFRPSEIQQRSFGEAITQVVKFNTVQKPMVVKLKFIDYELKKKCDEYIKTQIRPRQINYENGEVEKKKTLNQTADFKVEAPTDNFINLEDL